MNPAPDGRYLAAEPIDDALGQGVRIHTDADAVYEARSVEGAPARIHGNDDDWYAHIHLDASSDPVEGYDVFDEAVDRIDDAYDADIVLPATDFLDTVERRGKAVTRDGRITVVYRQEDDTTLDPGDGYSPRRHDHAMRMMKANAGGGAVGGAAIGAPFGPEAAAMAGAVGAMSGLCVGMIDGMLYDLKGVDLTIANGAQKGIDWSRRKREELKEWYRNRGERLQDHDLFARFNEKNRLETVADETRDPRQAQRYRELRDSDVEEEVDALFERHFDRFDKRQGVTTTIRTDRYEEAARFTMTVLDQDDTVPDHPSMFDIPAPFRRLFEAAHEERKEELIATVLQDGAADAVETYLDREHADLVQHVGSSTRLNAAQGGGQG